MERRWLSRLVTTLCIFIVLTADALGYDCKSRMEEFIDPNQSFPYDLMDQTLFICAIARRTINKIFRYHLF